MGELDGPRIGDTVDTGAHVVLRWNLAKLVNEAACMACGQVVYQVTAEAVRAGRPIPATFPHDCQAIVYRGEPQPIEYEKDPDD